MKKMNYSCPLVKSIFGLILSLSLLNPSKAFAAKPAEKGKEEADENITHVHHLALRGAYSEMPSTSLDPVALVMGAGLSSKSYFKLADHMESITKRKDIGYVVFDLSQAFSLSRVQQRDFAQRIAKLNK